MADILTAEQQAAVENRGRSLLVSAAAGSGKTKVLVERLFSYVESGEANLDDFLIITYTRAAAAELRGKIAKVLGEKLQEDPLNAHLQRQLLRVYRADIKTVDAFCTALLRENCHLLREDARGHALRPDFRVLDENEAQLLRERVLARTLDEFYETMREDDGASLLADTLGAGRDDRALGALVLELHGKLQAQPYMDRWLASQEQLWHDLPPRVEDTVYGTLLLSMVRRKALHCAALLRGAAQEMTSDAALADKYAPLFLSVAEQFALLAASAEEDWDAAAKRRVDFPRLTAVRKCEDEALKAKMQGVWNGCKKTAKGFDEVFSVTSAEAMEDLRAMAPAMLALLKLTADFSRAYHGNFFADGDAVFPIEPEHVLLAGEQGGVHFPQCLHHGGGDPAAVNFPTCRHGEGAGSVPNLRGKILRFLAAVDADAYDRPINASGGVQPHFREDSGEFLLSPDEVVRPLDAGAKPNGTLHRPAHRCRDGAGQVHQLLRGALRTQKDAHINSHPRRGQKRPSHPSPAAGLAVGDQDGAVGSALRSKHFQSCLLYTSPSPRDA